MSKIARLPRALTVKYQIINRKGKALTADPFVVSSQQQMSYYNATRCLEGVILDLNNKQMHFDGHAMGDELVYLLGFSVYSFQDRNVKLKDIAQIIIEFYDPAKGAESAAIHSHGLSFSADDETNCIVFGSFARNGAGGISYYQREDAKTLEYKDIRTSFDFVINK